MKIYRIHALVCSGAQCIAANGNGFEDALKDELKKHDLTEEVDIVETGCMGSCQLGPILVVYPEGVVYTKVKPEDAKEIDRRTFLEGASSFAASLETRRKEFFKFIRYFLFSQNKQRSF